MPPSRCSSLLCRCCFSNLRAGKGQGEVRASATLPHRCRCEQLRLGEAALASHSPTICCRAFRRPCSCCNHHTRLTARCRTAACGRAGRASARPACVARTSMAKSALLGPCCVSPPSHQSKPPAQQALPFKGSQPPPRQTVHSMGSQQPEPRSGQPLTCRKRHVLSPSFISEWTTPADEPGADRRVRRRVLLQGALQRASQKVLSMPTLVQRSRAAGPCAAGLCSGSCCA